MGEGTHARNERLLAEAQAFVERHHLVKGEYALTSSAILGVLGKARMADVDMVVSHERWSELAELYPEHVRTGFRIEIGNIEVFCQDSFPEDAADMPSVQEQLEKVELHGGLWVTRADVIIRMKRVLNRLKDQAHITILQGHLHQAER